MTSGAPLPLRFHSALGADAPKAPFHRRGNGQNQALTGERQLPETTGKK